jgi:hypothetical protein
MNKVTRMETGQLWQSNDPREDGIKKQVIAVNGDRATLRNASTGTRSTVDIKKFLSRQGTRSGYTCIEFTP